MNHELPSTPERYIDRLPVDAFNVEKLRPKQLAALVDTLHAAAEASEPVSGPNSEMSSGLEADMARLAEQAPDKAREFFMALTADDRPWPRAIAVGEFAANLVKAYHFAEDYEARQVVIDRWLELLEHDEDDFVRENAEIVLSKDVVCQDWIDEPTMRYLDTKLPPGMQRDDL